MTFFDLLGEIRSGVKIRRKCYPEGRYLQRVSISISDLQEDRTLLNETQLGVFQHLNILGKNTDEYLGLFKENFSNHNDDIFGNDWEEFED